MDFDFKRRSKVCSKTERELGAGEKYFSVLSDLDGDIVRTEISAGAWEGPPEGCISWWQARIPERGPNKFFWAPDNVIIDYFESFLDDEDRAVERFVLALLLIRKRIFKLVDSESDEDGNETMYIACSRRDSDYEVMVCHPEDDQIEAIQAELDELLFSDEPFEEDELEEDSELEVDGESEEDGQSELSEEVDLPEMENDENVKTETAETD